jgi:hypothetical protein
MGEDDSFYRMGVSTYCDKECAVDWLMANPKKVKSATDKIKAKREKEQRKKDKERMQSLKTVGDYIKDAQAAVNKYIRLRDAKKPCISCGNTKSHKIGLSGHRYDAGHYRSRGSAGHLRFNLLNIHKQCVYCNRDMSGNLVEYRKELINRIGLERVERLEYDNSLRSFDIEYLKRIKKIFNKRARWYEKRR